jgi:hypothetical protein
MAGVLELLILCLLVYYLVPRFTTTVDAEPEPKDLDRFSEEEWNDFVRRTGVLRSYDSSGRFAPKRLFSVRAERLHDVCQRVNRLVEGDGTTIEARSKNVSQSLATDKGGQMSGGGGVPGGQGSIVAALGKQKSQDTSSAQDGKTEDERHRSRFIAMELFLHTDWLELSQDCKDFFASTPTHKSLDTALRDFQKDFGLHFYQAVELGVSREKISAMSQDNRSQTSNEDRSRQLQLEVTGQGPCANAGAGAHRNTDRHVGDSSATKALINIVMEEQPISHTWMTQHGELLYWIQPFGLYCRTVYATPPLVYISYVISPNAKPAATRLHGTYNSGPQVSYHICRTLRNNSRRNCNGKLSQQVNEHSTYILRWTTRQLTYTRRQI